MSLLRIFIITLIFPLLSEASYLKISGTGGVGNFTGSREGQSKSEGPFAFAFGIDYDINSRWSLGAEHQRSFSMKPVGTSVSMTGFTGRYYYVSPVPNPLAFDEPYLNVRVLQYGIFPYVGWSAGFSQASLDGEGDAVNVIALNLAVALKAGYDLPFYKSVAIRNEINFGLPLMGTGQISFFSILVGGVYFW